MQLIKKDQEIILGKAIAGCHSAQDYAKPLIDKTAYENGLKCEQKLGTIMTLASGTPNCDSLRSELANLDDLMYQLRYVRLGPLLPLVEDIESHLQKFIKAQGITTFVKAQTATSPSPDASKRRFHHDHPEISKAEFDLSHLPSEELKGGDVGRNPAYRDPFSDSFQSFSDDEEDKLLLSDDEEEEEEPKVQATSKPLAKKSSPKDKMPKFEVIVEESENETERSEPEEITLPQAFNSSQQTIDGLLEALNGSGDTLDLIQAALEMKDDEEFTMNKKLDLEMDALEAALEPSVDGSYQERHAEEESDKASGEDTTCAASLSESQTDTISLGLSAISELSDQSEEEQVEASLEALERQKALLSAQEKKFFDRLHHLFEVRKKAEKRMKKIDPKDKLKALDITVHSGGIKNEDGTYKTEYQQLNVDGEVAKNLVEVYAGAHQCRGVFIDLVYGACDKVKGLDHFDSVILDPKPQDRAAEKARTDYSHREPGPPETWLYDVLRATITCKTVKQVEAVNKYLCKKAHIVQAKNRFVEPTYTSYRDILYHVQLKHEYKATVRCVAEIQVQLQDVVELQQSLGMKAHMLYFRSCFSGPERPVMDTLKDLKILEKHGSISSKLIKALLKSENATRLSIIAQLLHEKVDCYDHSIELYSRVLELHKAEFGEVHSKTAATYQCLGLVYGKKGDFEDALHQLKKCLELQEQVFGTNHSEVATTRSHLGHLICLTGEMGDDESSGIRGALREHRQALSIRKKALGKDHVDVASSFQNIGLALGQLGEYIESLEAYRSALEILQKALSPNHPDVAATHSMIATVLCQQHNFDEAMKEYTTAFDIRSEKLGKNHPVTADSHTEIGNMLCEKGDLEGALSRHKEALRIRQVVLGKDHPDCAVSLSNIGYVMSRQGDFDGALIEHRKALSIRDAILGKRHPDALASRQSIKYALKCELEP